MIRIGLVLLAGAAATVVAAHPAPDFNCAMRATADGWCDGCEIGYVVGVEIRSKKLFESLDVHGHEVEDPAAMDCMMCRKAFKANRYCGDCKVGFAWGHAHFTKLTWLLARGRRVDVATVACTACRRATATPKLPLPDIWCEVDERGWLGNVAFTDKARYAEARKHFERLLRALKESERCEDCAMGMFFDQRCRVCEITYRDGKPVEP